LPGNYWLMGKASSLQSIRQVQPSDRLVYLVTRDNQFAAFISQQIIHFGYYVQHVRDIRSLANVTVEHPSVAILVDIPSTGEDIFIEIKEFKNISNPLVFISEADDQVVRLKSIRVGGTAFFTKPINIVGLIDKLDSLNPTTTKTTQPYRVLIVDDQQSVASYYQMVLKMSGMDAQFVTDSNDVLNQVREFHPDLILMDTFMPEIRGTDLVRVIRQIDEFVSIPIVFLSSEDDFDRRIEALDLGGDDFLVKPIKASHLMAVVRSRLERLKTLRSFMVRDSLTNLLNHTAFRSVLTQEVNRSKRQDTKLALAMLDIDHFKKVNDAYGHAAGDSVLKSLSRLLKQRLRRSDIIGRYGGEEFVALLLDCKAEQALEIMNEIRVHFSEVNFYPNEASALSVTFSCGISTFPEYRNPQDLSDASDQALYIAKASGRNQVIVARP
jgi:diguanylate cyclase (GGDEF)-like protein